MAMSGLVALPELANAQSNVSLYGIIDTSIYYQNKTPNNNGKLIEMLDGSHYSSMWGMRGTEDLGGGLHAGFAIESGFLSTNGAIGNSNGNLFGHNAFVSLDGAFGTAKAGLLYSPFIVAILDTDPQGLPNLASEMGIYGNNFGPAGLFASSTMSYTTPDLGGFSGSLMFGPGGVPGNFKAGKQQSFSVKYSGHGLMAEIAYLDINDSSGATAQQGRLAGASYQFGPVTVSGAFVNYRMPTAAAIRNVYVYSTGLRYSVTPALFIHAGVYASRDQDNSANKSMLYSLGTLYLLSKRTSVYAQVGMVHNQGIMQTGLNAQDPKALFNFPAGTTVGMAIGLEHRF
jgi:predicted porin